MRIRNWTPNYALGFVLVWFTKQGYFSRVTRQGLSNIPKGKPIIFAPNHQNSLIDPIVIATTNKYPVFFLTKSDVFKKPAIAKILYSINMLPIYRERDGADFIEKNKAIFDRCSEILASNSRIIIFPEGSHNNKNRLRQLKKGIARISIQADEIAKEDIYIVPVGLNYSNTRNKCADLLVSFGEAINASEIINSVSKDSKESERINPLMLEIDKGLRKEMLDYKNDSFYELYDFLISKVRRPRTSLKNKFKWNKAKSEKLNDFIESNQEKSKVMLEEVQELDQVCEKENLRPYLFAKKSHSLFLPILELVVGFPLFLYGVINSYFPAIIPERTILKKIKDRQYDSSINMVMGGFLMFLFWSVQSLVVSLFTDHYIWVLYFISCVVSRWFSYEYHIFYLRFKGKMNLNKFIKTNKELGNSYHNKYIKLKQFIYDL